MLTPQLLAIVKYVLCPVLYCFISADARQKDIDNALRPDAAMRDPSRVSTPGARASLKEQLDEQSRGERSTKLDGNPKMSMDWCSDELVIEFKRSHVQDPFTTEEEIQAQTVHQTELKRKDINAEVTPIVFEHDSAMARRTRGQLASYATEVFAHQHRTHLFQLLITGHYARFLRWDHSGAIVSDRFNYVEQPTILAKFLWAYNHMSPAQRGWDETATMASEDETKEFNDAVVDYEGTLQGSGLELPKSKEKVSEAYPVYKIKVADDDKTKPPVDVLVREAFFRTSSVLGRATRVFVAYVLNPPDKKSCLRCLKDTWRVVHPRLRPEREILSDFAAKGIEYVPEVICGGDVIGPQHLTMAVACAKLQEKLMGYSECLRDFQHHRLLEPLAFPVTLARNSDEFMTVFFHCFLGELVITTD